MQQNQAPSGNPATGDELPKQYRPAEHEDRIRARWDESQAFHADPQRVLSGQAKPFCVLIPPPNVTDRLHLGHALNNTLQDVIVRLRRMQGFETLWMAGTDHAGIATQAVVERRLKKEENLTRQKLGREAFVARVQAWKDEYEATITDQLQRMGCSCDWDRQRFTMDDVCAKAVREAFFRLFSDALIYRGKRLVNWDPALQTAVADDETYDEEIDGKFYYLRYPLVDERENPVTWAQVRARGWSEPVDSDAAAGAWITVATTRPETYLGDTAVALSPRDPRAGAVRGLRVKLPFVGRVIPIVEDDYVVLPARYAVTDEQKADPKAAMATGFLKVTPAHDQNDADIGRRHSLAAINVMAPDGSISDAHGWTDVGDARRFVGLTRDKARDAVVKAFEESGLFEGSKPHRHSVKHSDRSKAIIEPYLSDQWYVRVTDPRLAASANAAMTPHQRSSSSPSPASASLSASSAKSADQSADSSAGSNSLHFHPDRYARTFELWHEQIRDWCISRQLWWGHRIPVWSSDQNDGRAFDAWITSNRVAIQRDGAMCYICVRDSADREAIEGIERAGFAQDSDVLDTWFSSALWPMSTMGWPDPQQAGPMFAGLLQAFNPSSTLCTAREIITLWVSRMVMFNRYLMPMNWPGVASLDIKSMARGQGPVPFTDVVIHSVIQDGEGRKMSKSLGNGVDPLDIIHSHGSDAMRFTLCQMATQTQDVRMPVQKDSTTGRNTSNKFDLGRNVCNKLWNASRFTISMVGIPSDNVMRTSPLSIVDRWMMSRLESGVRAVTSAIESYTYSDAAQGAYDLMWRDFCDWYLEAVKPTIAGDANQRTILRTALEVVLRIMHPIAPYITEAIFEKLPPLARLPEGVTMAPARRAALLATAGWPTIDPSWHDPAAERAFDRDRALITAIREVRSQHNVAPKRRITLHAPPGFVRDGDVVVATLAMLEGVTSDAPTSGAVAFTVEKHELHLSGMADVMDSGAERARLEKLITDSEKSVTTLTARLANPGYADRAPPAMVQQTRDQLAKAVSELELARTNLAKLA